MTASTNVANHLQLVTSNGLGGSENSSTSCQLARTSQNSAASVQHLFLSISLVGQGTDFVMQAQSDAFFACRRKKYENCESKSCHAAFLSPKAVVAVALTAQPQPSSVAYGLYSMGQVVDGRYSLVQVTCPSTNPWQ
jgi:hypothetical protein